MKVKSLFLILVLFMLVGGFSIVPFFLQATFYNPQTPPPVQMPTTSIIDYELSPDQETEILRQGKAIVRFEYNLNCDRCLETQSILEQLVNFKQFKNQIVLEEITSNANNLPRVSIVGFSVAGDRITVGQKSLMGGNVTEPDIVNSLCELVLQPPIECTLKDV